MARNIERVALIRVIDGDTVVVQRSGLFRKKQDLRIRLYGMDAPESNQSGGKESTNHLKRMLGGARSIELEDRGTDQYGRTIGVLWHKGRSMNLEMVRAGQAHVYLVQEPERGEYYAAEREAKNQNLGIWGRKKQEVPTKFRQKEKAREAFKRKLLFWAIGAAVIAAIVLYLLSQA